MLKNKKSHLGRIFVEDDYNGLVKVDDEGYGGTWTLSEDKDDRKDGLWVWGLFEEPKYPFLYFYLDIFPTVIVSKQDYKPQTPTSVPAVTTINKDKILQGINSDINDNDYLDSVVKIEIKNPNLVTSDSSKSSVSKTKDETTNNNNDDLLEIPIFDGKSIPKNRLNFRFDFNQKSINDGITLQNGQVNYQLTEIMNADVFGIGGQVDVGEYVDAGRVNILYVPDE